MKTSKQPSNRRRDHRLVGLYRCPACGQAYERESDKKWINSYCEKTGRNVRLQRTTWEQHKPWPVKFVRGLGKPNAEVSHAAPPAASNKEPAQLGGVVLH